MNEKQYVSKINEYYIKDSELEDKISASETEVLQQVSQTYATKEGLETTDAKIQTTADNVLSQVANTYVSDTEFNEEVSTIDQRATNIESTVSHKVGDNEIISKINQSAEEIKILASKLNLSAEDVVNILAGETINLVSKELKFSSSDGEPVFNIFSKDSEDNYSAICNLYPAGITFNKVQEEKQGEFNYAYMGLSDPNYVFDLCADPNENIIQNKALNIWGEFPVGYILFNNSSGSNTTVTLADSSANYQYLEIFYHNANNEYGSVKVFSPNGKKAILGSYNANISGTTLTISNTNITVTRVVGYKGGLE